MTFDQGLSLIEVSIPLVTLAAGWLMPQPGKIIRILTLASAITKIVKEQPNET